MKLSLSSNKNLLNKAKKFGWPVMGLATVSAFLLGASRQAYSPIVRKMALKSDSTTATSQPAPASSSAPAAAKPGSVPAPAGPPVQALQIPVFNHTNIITTYFWVGEKASKDNGYIANNQSAWDENWETHFGGEDTPSARSGYYPAAFTPKENPFYFALPYSDIDDSGNRKTTATSCPLYATMKNQPYSWCKNSWIAIQHGGKLVYAQWQDVGPFEEDDAGYVFGTSAPKNKDGVKSGLDVSPAVRGYLGLQDVDHCDWAFVPAQDVPAGPWKQITTTNFGDSI